MSITTRVDLPVQEALSLMTPLMARVTRAAIKAGRTVSTTLVSESYYQSVCLHVDGTDGRADFSVFCDRVPMYGHKRRQTRIWRAGAALSSRVILAQLADPRH